LLHIPYERNDIIVSSLIYRQIEPSETAAAATLACEVFDQFVAPCYQPEGVSEFHRYASADALSHRHVSGHATYVAERGGELVGMLHLCAPCHVAMLFIQSSLQRSGIARALLASAGDANCKFTVNSSPNAVAAYQRLGFRVTGSEQCVHGIRFIPMQRLRVESVKAPWEPRSFTEMMVESPAKVRRRQRWLRSISLGG
jgi:GNAT superfamily N-acetyltransferase